MDSRQLKRVYQRLVTGLQIAQNFGADMRFMSLTTAPNRVIGRTGKERTLKDSFDILRQRVARATVAKDGFVGFKFNRYFNLRTLEGNGVLHVIYWGRFIPVEWLRKAWLEIHGAFEVDIRMVSSRRRKVNGLVGYLLDRYLMSQKVKRMSYGWRWAWLGFCKSWQKVKDTYGLMRRWVRWKGENDDSHRVKSAHEMFINHSVDAWRCTLWCYPMTSRQLKLKGSPNQRYWEDGFDRKELDLPVKKAVAKEGFTKVEGEVERMLNARSALFRFNVHGGGV